MANKIQICSIDPYGFKNISRTYNPSLDFPACPKDKEYVSKWYEDGTDYEIILQDYWIEHAKKVPVHVPVAVIVRDLMQTEGMAKRGCFIPAGDKPTQDELQKAFATRLAYMEAMIQAGDTEYARTGKMDDIPQETKRYVAELKLDKPWAYWAKSDLACPACGESLTWGVAVCKTCGAILDAEKAAKWGLGPKVEKEKPVKVV